MVRASGTAERLNTKEASLSIKLGDGPKQTESLGNADHHQALLKAVHQLSAEQQSRVEAIGHRVVHGGEEFHEPTLVDASILEKIEALSDLAPLHNPAAVEGIRIAQKLFPKTPQVAVFDTAFHQTLPPHAFHYAVPLDLYRKYKVRRYGFHGTSHHYVALETAKRLSRPLESLQLVTAHLGNGCSAAAIKNGCSVDTTMGLTPQEGLMMGTRSGDVDPTLHSFLGEKEHLSLVQITDLLTRQSGLLGVSGVSQDMRSVCEAADQGNEDARLALDLFCYRLARGILSLTASLERIDALVFTGGIGENSARVRAQALGHLAILNPHLDPAENETHGREQGGRITRDSGLTCLVVPTNEELMIAQQTAELLAKG
jgi:acetate kinase